MKTGSISKYLPTILLIVFCLWHSNAEATDQKIIDSFLEEGDQYYQKKDMVRALESFSRAFLLDPQEKTARDRLLALIEKPDLTGAQKVNLHQLRGLIKTLNNLTSKLEYYDGRINEFIQDLVLNGADQELLRLEMMLVEKRHAKNFEDSLNELREGYRQHDDALGMIIASLMQKRAELLVLQEIRAQQFDRLRLISRTEEPSSEITLTTEDFLQLPVLQETRFTAGQSVPKNDQVVDLSLQLTEVQEKLLDKDRQLDTLKGQVDALISQVALNEEIIKEKNDELLAFNRELTDLQEQLRLRQKIVQEKEENIERMEEASQTDNALNEKYELLKAAAVARDRDNAQLERMLQISHEKIVELEKGISRQSRKGFKWFWEGNGGAVQQDEALADARELDSLTANKFKELVKERDRAIVQKDEQIGELKGVLGMYQALLKEAKESFALTNQNMQTLQEEFVALKEQLIRRGQLVLDAEYKLISLKKDLTNMQTRLVTIRNLPETKNYVKLENEILELEDEMNNIHKFLLKQLDDFERLNKDVVAGEIDVDKVLRLNFERIERE